MGGKVRLNSSISKVANSQKTVKQNNHLHFSERSSPPRKNKINSPTQKTDRQIKQTININQ